MQTNLKQLIKIFIENKPTEELGVNENGPYGNNFHCLGSYHKMIANNRKILKQIVKFEDDINHKSSGVYMIGDYYIGSTTYGKSSKSGNMYNGIMNRIIGHINEMCYYYWNIKYNEYGEDRDDVRYNYLKTYRMWLDFIENDYIIVRKLSNNPSDENDLINQYLNDGYDLQNPKQLEYRATDNNIRLALKYHRGWNMDGIWFDMGKNNWLKLFDVDVNGSKLYFEFYNNKITREEFIKQCKHFNISFEDLGEEFTEFDKQYRQSHEQISIEQINKYTNDR